MKSSIGTGDRLGEMQARERFSQRLREDGTEWGIARLCGGRSRYLNTYRGLMSFQRRRITASIPKVGPVLDALICCPRRPLHTTKVPCRN